MPASQFPTRLIESFNAETVRVLTDVFNDAWQRLEVSGIAATDDAEVARDKLARCIVDLAKQGVSDPSRLRDYALGEFGKSFNL
jgi:hypothetical protein